MINKIRKVKIIILFLLCFVLNTFIVNASDDDMFITKSEFSTINDKFLQQINEIGTNIDKNIDSAIAEYLAGIRYEQEFSVESIINKFNVVLPVSFVKTWNTPYTKKGNHSKQAANIVVSPLVLAISDSTSVYRGATGTKTIGGVTYWGGKGLFEAKIGLSTSGAGSWPCDSLSWGEISPSDNAQKNILYKVFYDDKYDAYYTTKDEVYDMTPTTLIFASKIGGTHTDYVIPAGVVAADIYSTIGCKFINSFKFEDWSNKPFGNIVEQGDWQFYGLVSTGIYKPQTGTKNDVIEIFDSVNCNAVKVTDDTLAVNRNMWNLLAGGSLSSSNILCVLDTDWDIAHTTYHSQFTNWQAYTTIISNKKSSEGLPAFWQQKAGSASKFGLPAVKTWLKKNSSKAPSEFILHEYSAIANQSVKYYMGVPLFKSNVKGKICVELNFTQNGDIDTGQFAIRDSAFSNSSSVTSNVTLYNDDGTTYIDMNLLSQDSQTKIFYIEAEAGKTYWIKVCPDSTNLITVNSANSEFIGKRSM